MNTYTFVLNFELPQRTQNAENHLDALFEAGCDDATIGVGQYGVIGLDFARSAESAEEALRSAIDNVQTAIPGAVLVQAGPDLVGLTQIAELFSFSRQNMRKYATAHSATRDAFPAPVVAGETGLWHLAEVIAWLTTNTAVSAPSGLLDVSKATAKLNFEIEKTRLRRIVELA